jgi:hypothetical protein
MTSKCVETPPRERFQFRIRDLLLAMILAGLLATAIARDSILLLYVFGLASGLFLRLFWKRPASAKVLVFVGCVVLFFVFHWAGEIKSRDVDRIHSAQKHLLKGQGDDSVEGGQGGGETSRGPEKTSELFRQVG